MYMYTITTKTQGNTCSNSTNQLYTAPLIVDEKLIHILTPLEGYRGIHVYDHLNIHTYNHGVGHRHTLLGDSCLTGTG